MELTVHTPDNTVRGARRGKLGSVKSLGLCLAGSALLLNACKRDTPPPAEDSSARSENRTPALANPESSAVRAPTQDSEQDFHGVLTNSYGQPIVGATVTFSDNEDPTNTPLAKVQSDSLGAYRIANPPFVGGPLVVRCPKSTRHPDALMAVSNLWVKPGRQIAFDMKIDGRICDEEGSTPQGIQPPFDAPPLQNAADSARARNATYPSDEETAVYRTVLDGISRPDTAHTMLVYATTRSLCKGPECPEKYSQTIRYVPEVMLVTMEDFLSVREKRIDFKAEFPGRPSTALIGDSTLSALFQATGQSDVLNNWSLIHMAYPSVQTVVSFSRVAFSPHHKQAMVELTRGDINGFRESQLYVVDRQPAGDWRIVKWFNGPSRQ